MTQYFYERIKSLYVEDLFKAQCEDLDFDLIFRVFAIADSAKFKCSIIALLARTGLLSRMASYILVCCAINF